MTDSEFRLHLRYLLRGTASLLFLATLWILIGKWAERMELGFLRISLVPGANPVKKSNGDAIVTVSRSRAAIRFSDQKQVLHAGEEISQAFVLSSASPSKTHRLEFFISGDMRARAAPMMKREINLWKDLPIEYSVSVNGRIVSQGPVEQIFRAMFLDIPPNFLISAGTLSSDNVIVLLKLRCIKDVSILPPIRTALAFEYPFYRDGSADRGSNNLPSEHAPDIRIHNDSVNISR